MTNNSLQEFIADFSQMRSRVLANVRNAFYIEARNILEELKLRSPVDKDVFRKNWELQDNNPIGLISSFTIQNSTKYGSYLDEGGIPGGKPWYWPNKKHPGPTSKSGKLTEDIGRVWAGGRSPSGFVIGGIVDPVIFNNPARQQLMAEKVADAVIEVI